MFPPFSTLGIVSLIISVIYFLLLVKVFKSKEIFLNIGICLLFIWLFFYFGGTSFGLDMWLYESMCATIAFFATVILGHIILVYALVKFFKSKNKKWLTGVFVSLFLFYLTLPWYFYTGGLIKWDIKHIETATKLAIFPKQKGYLYLHTAEMMGYNNIPLRLKYYEKAHKYLEYNASIYTKEQPALKVWKFAPFDCYNAGDFDKAIEIGKAVEDYHTVSNAYIMKNDYQNALRYVDKNIEQSKKPSAWNYIYKANILRNLNNEQEALIYYKKAIKLTGNDTKFAKKITEYYNNKNSVKEAWEKQRAEYIAKGFVL